MASKGNKWPSQFDGWSGRSKPPNYDENYEREYRWGNTGTLFSNTSHVELELPVDLYEYCTNRARIQQYGVYVADPFQEPFLNDVIDRIGQTISSSDPTKAEMREALTEFVQSLDYTRDVEDTGHMVYPKYPIETLRHRQGDCEDSTILLGSLLHTLGYDIALVIIPSKHHMVLGVSLDNYMGTSVGHDGTDYYLLETTDTGWEPGNVPTQYAGAEVEIHLPNEQPVLVHEWEAVPAGSGKVEVSFHVANFGDGTANNVNVQLTFKHRDGDIETAVVFEPESKIEPGESVSTSELLELKPETKLQATCEIGIDRILHDESQSEWK